MEVDNKQDSDERLGRVFEDTFAASLVRFPLQLIGRALNRSSITRRGPLTWLSACPGAHAALLFEIQLEAVATYHRGFRGKLVCRRHERSQGP